MATSTTAEPVDLLVKQGSTFLWSATLCNEDDVTKVRTPINLTGMTARMMARRRITDTSPLITLTTENGGIALGGTAGTIQITISAPGSAALPACNGFYDFELVNASTVDRLFEGRFTITPEVTRP